MTFFLFCVNVFDIVLLIPNRPWIYVHQPAAGSSWDGGILIFFSLVQVEYIQGVWLEGLGSTYPAQ